MDRLGKAPANGGCKDDDWFIWCPSVIEVEGVYHLFASRWPARLGFGAWGSDSEIARYTATDPGGPFVFQETVLETHYDPPIENTAHNPEIHRAGDGTGMLYYQAGEVPRKRGRIGMATAPSITGPWTRHGLWDMCYNPSAVVHADNSVYFALNGFGGIDACTPCHLRLRGAGVNKVKAWKAPHYSCWPMQDYQLGFVIDEPDAHPEDICLFFVNDHYEMIAHRYDHGADNRDGIHFVSADATGAPGTWRKAEPFVCYGPEIEYDDGTRLTVERRERPKVLQDAQGRVTCLYTAVLKDGKSWIVGVPVNPPYSGCKNQHSGQPDC
jgi:hypothetical protein